MVGGGILNLVEQQQQTDRLPRNRKCLYANLKHYFSFSTVFFSHHTNPTLQQIQPVSSVVHEVSVTSGLTKTTVCVCVLGGVGREVFCLLF